MKFTVWIDGEQREFDSVEELEEFAEGLPGDGGAVNIDSIVGEDGKRYGLEWSVSIVEIGDDED